MSVKQIQKDFDSEYADRQFATSFEYRRDYYQSLIDQRRDERSRAYVDRAIAERFKGYEHEIKKYDEKTCPECGYSPIPHWCRICKSCWKKEMFGR